ncbi:Nucleolar protein 10 [Morella rubra]|uniref:Nucleolar protein 10 n=1 Tax=Morella rubra TaxID=262757 RepID=A0A6A1WAI0_9ROSI|nr:Nucleolar protein 10 [Morella rubra]KAB1222225.1 Nucleolar protein 10 [Morella rubra]
MAYQGGSLKSTSINGVQMYTVASQNRSLASWLDPKKLRALRKDENYMQRVELIQDLKFETATTKIKETPDGQFLIASGIYPPQVKVYDLRQLALKFERHLDSEIIDFQVLDDDYSKLAFLCADRSVCLHAKYGKHYTLRIPRDEKTNYLQSSGKRMGRAIAYDCWSCDLLCAASSPDLYRINLEQGRFLSSLTTQSPAINVISRRMFDMRMRVSVGRIDAVAPAGDKDQEVTSLEFDRDGGFQLAVGISTGKVLIYDLRSSYPIRVKDHMYGSPILDIKWHRTLNSEQPKLITTDSHVVRIWDPETGEGMTSIEPTAGSINDICAFSGSGLMLLALDCSQIPSYFVPALGPAPKWCSYLENLTAKALVDPFAYDSYIEQRKREKLENERASRITIRRKLPKVNRDLAARILETEEAENEKRDADDKEIKKASKKKKGLSSDVLEDERFTAMFSDKNFEIDEESFEYLSYNPMSSKKQPSLVEEHFEPVMEDADQSLSDSDLSAASESSEGELGDDKSKTWKKARAPRLYEVKDERHAEAFHSDVSLATEDLLPIGERVAALKDDQQHSGIWSGVKFGPGGSREISFTSRSSAKYKEDEEDKELHLGKRRGVQSLGLKPETSGFRGRGRGFNRGRGRRGGGRGGSRGRGGGGGGGRGRGRGRGRW